MCSRLVWSSVSQPVLVGRNWDWTDVVPTELYATPLQSQERLVLDAMSVCSIAAR